MTDSQLREVRALKDFIGNLERPVPEELNSRHSLIISGWVFGKRSAIKGLLLSVNESPKEPIVYGISRPDVAKAFPEIPKASFSGFNWMVLLKNGNARNLDIRIWAVMEDGSHECCFSGRIEMEITRRRRRRAVNSVLLLIALKMMLVDVLRQKISPSFSKMFRSLRRYYWTLLSYQGNQDKRSGLEKKDPYQSWLESNRLTPRLLDRMKKEVERLEGQGPKISVVVPVFNTPRKFLEEMIDSVSGQIYGNWELCIADDASTNSEVRNVLKKAMSEDPRIRVIFRKENGHIAEATNSALEIATGEYVAFLDHDDTLSPDALLHVTECVYRNPDTDWIYTDEDKIDGMMNRYDPQFKGDWNPEMAITHNFTHHLAVIRRGLVDKVGWMRRGFEGAQDLDLFLRVAENTSPDRIRHIPQICYHWRSHPKSTASHGTQKQYVFDNAYCVIKEAIRRRGLRAEPFLPEIAKKNGLCLHQLRWDKGLLAEHPVTIVIPTKDRSDLLKRCVSSLARTVDKRFVKLLIVDDCSTESRTREYLSKLEREGIFQCRVIQPKRNDGSFSYARLMNEAIEYVDTPLLLLLNNDVEAIHPGWLEDMVGWMSVDGVGAVGARLLYPNLKIQHAGVLVGPGWGLADHQFRYLDRDEIGYLVLPHAARDVSAVTGACLLTPTSVYRALGGLDEVNLPVQFNDIDYCLRLRKNGKRIVYTPQAILIHQEQASRGTNYDTEECLRFVNKHRGYTDPYSNPNLLPDSMHMAVNPVHYSYAGWSGQLKLLWIVNSLGFEGAPMVALQTARFIQKYGWEVHILSAKGGPLEEAYHKSGIPVETMHQQMEGMRRGELEESLKAIGEKMGIGFYDLLIADTIKNFWGIQLAKLFNLPSVWFIHESTHPQIEASTLPGSVREMFYESFLQATRVVFRAKATQSLYQDLGLNKNFTTIPNGFAVDRVDEFLKLNKKEALRAKYKIPLDHCVVTILGTVCLRKGQHIFLKAISELQNKYPLPNVSYLIVGARKGNHTEGRYREFLLDEIKRMSVENIHVLDETPNAYDFFGLSDIFVCASFEESFPIVLLEAMAFGLGIVTTNVFGISEMVSQENKEAILVPSGDPLAMSQAILRLLKDPGMRRLLGKNARAKAERVFREEIILKRVLALIQEAFLCYDPKSVSSAHKELSIPAHYVT